MSHQKNKPITQSESDNDSVIGIIISLLENKFTPANSIKESDIFLTTKELIRSVDSLVTLTPEQEAELIVQLIALGYNTDTIVSENQIKFYWCFRYK